MSGPEGSAGRHEEKPQMELSRIEEIIEENKGKEFVARIAKAVGKEVGDPSIPSIDMGKDAEGNRQTGTHMMAADWDDESKRWMVYPTIVMIEGKLEHLEVNEAMHHAKVTGEFIDFDQRKDEAVAFSKEYKRVWGADDG